MNMPTPVYILHWNRPQECVDTVASFRAQTGVTLRIVVLDNGSDAPQLETLRRLLPAAVEVREIGSNRGWGGGFNTVLDPWAKDLAGDEFCIVSAHDARLSPECVARLLQAMVANPRLGICCPRYDNQIVAKFSALRGLYLVDQAPPVAPGGVEYMPAPHGTVMVFRRACLAEIGTFDERYFAYGDEHDIGLRSNAAGWSVGMVWEAEVVNPGTWTPNALVRYLVDRNSLLLVRDHAGFFSSTARAFLMGANAIRQHFRGAPDERSVVHARWLAIGDFFLQHFGRPTDARLYRGPSLAEPGS